MRVRSSVDRWRLLDPRSRVSVEVDSLDVGLGLELETTGTGLGLGGETVAVDARGRVELDGARVRVGPARRGGSGRPGP
jgi:hypothetical protein